MLKEIIPANPPLLDTGDWWNACGLRKSWSKRIPSLILCEYLFATKKIKKVINANTDKKLDSNDSFCIY